jgi:ribonuclease HII
MICGTDEAGRGPLAGPVYAAAVILNPKRRIRGIADSKAISEQQRNEVAEAIRRSAIAWAVAWATEEEIDTLNILRASLLAMKRAVENLSVQPLEVLVDGIYCPELSCASRAIIGGDATEPAISAASILAKTARDAEMLRLHALHPEYGFDRNKGYPTKAHLDALAMHGACAVHRRSFAPVRKVLETWPKR